MPKFKDSSCHIPAGKPADLRVEKETLMIRTDILTEPCKKPSIQSRSFYEIHNFNDFV